MKITLTGSIGHIGKPLTKELIKKGHSVTVISSNSERAKEIETIGGKPLIGSVLNVDFLISAFKGADAVYCMVPPANYFDQSLDLPKYYSDLGNNYAAAIKKTEIKKVVNLSSIGAHLEKGNGILSGTYQVEKSLNELPQNVDITHIRPTEFYYNLLPQVHSVKANGFMASNIGADVVNAWVSPIDIASAVANELVSKSQGRKVRYVASEEITYNKLVSILGKAIGKPELHWVTITNGQMKSSLVSVGMQPECAEGLIEMYSAVNSGLLYEHYNLHKPKSMGKIKVEDFAKDFDQAYNKL